MQAVGRYHVGINYNAVEGHIITAEKTADGMLYLYDAQSGNFINIDEFREAESFEILKVDKFLISKDVLKKIKDCLVIFLGVKPIKYHLFLLN